MKMLNILHNKQSQMSYMTSLTTLMTLLPLLMKLLMILTTLMALTIGRSKGDVLPGPISFIFVQFSANNLPNNRLAPPPGNPGSDTVNDIGQLSCKPDCNVLVNIVGISTMRSLCTVVLQISCFFFTSRNCALRLC